MEVSKNVHLGALKVSDDVIATIARLAALEVEGVDALEQPSVSFKRLFIHPGKNGGVKIKLSGDVVELSMGIFVKFGHKVTLVAESVQERVKSDIQSMTGVTVSRVNVSVSGIVFDAENKE